jgi:Domain of unknown function (DUF3899)
LKLNRSFIGLTLFIFLLSSIIALLIDLTLKVVVDSWFIVSAMITCILIFKYILDRGAFDLFRYNWNKTKKFVFFFLPKYWKRNEAYLDEEEFDTLDDFRDYREKRVWQNMNWLLITALIHLFLSIILSFVVYTI